MQRGKTHQEFIFVETKAEGVFNLRIVDILHKIEVN